MAAMINRYAARALMLPKSPAELCRHFRAYAVLTGPTGEVVACAGLRVYSPDLAEIVGLAVHEDWQRRGLGGRLVDHLLEQAARIGVRRVFAMAIHPALFEGRGFRRIAPERLPEKTGGDCRSCPRRAACREVALLLELRPPESSAATPAARRRATRVLPLRVVPARTGRAPRRRG